MTYKSKFGFGCMRLPLTDKNDPTSIDQDLFNEMVVRRRTELMNGMGKDLRL